MRPYCLLYVDQTDKPEITLLTKEELVEKIKTHEDDIASLSDWYKGYPDDALAIVEKGSRRYVNGDELHLYWREE